MDSPRAAGALAEIRSVELEMARRLDDARGRVTAEVAAASERARRAVAEAQELGMREAEQRRRRRLADADADAERIRRTGEADAAQLLATLRPLLLLLVDDMLAIVLPDADESG